jgi:hypothetical protein
MELQDDNDEAMDALLAELDAIVPPRPLGIDEIRAALDFIGPSVFPWIMKAKCMVKIIYDGSIRDSILHAIATNCLGKENSVLKCKDHEIYCENIEDGIMLEMCFPRVIMHTAITSITLTSFE